MSVGPQTAQGARQESVRAITGTDFTYDGDWNALFDLDGIPAGDTDGRLLRWINGQLSASYTNLPEAMQKFAESQGYFNWSSMGTFETSYSTEAQQFFDRLLTPPTTARAALYADLIDALVTAGVWAKLDALVICAAADSGTALINLVQGAFDASLNGVGGNPAFTVDSGFAVRGVNTSIRPNYVPSTAGGNLTQNDAMVAVGNLGTGVTNNSALIRPIDGSEWIEIYPKQVSGNAIWAMNGNNVGVSTANAGDTSGLWMIERTASNAQRLYRDNTQVGVTNTNASAALTSQGLNIIGAVGSDVLIWCYAIGASLSTDEKAAFNTALQAYKTAVGA